MPLTWPLKAAIKVERVQRSSEEGVDIVKYRYGRGRQENANTEGTRGSK
jgi:hypothetical protein